MKNINHKRHREINFNKNINHREHREKLKKKSPRINTDRQRFKIFILLFKNKKYWARLGNLVQICLPRLPHKEVYPVKCEAIFNRERLYQGEISWFLFGVWCGLCGLNFKKGRRNGSKNTKGSFVY